MDMNLKKTQGSPILSFLMDAGGLVLLGLRMRTASGILNPLFLALIFASDSLISNTSFPDRE